MLAHEDEKVEIAEVLSGVENCRAKKLTGNQDEVVMCLMHCPLCDYAIAFGYNLLLCSHPKRMEIVEKTKAEDV